MELIRESKYLKNVFDAAHSLIENIWLPSTHTIESYQLEAIVMEEIEALASLVRKYKPKLMISDERHRHFVYNIDMQAKVSMTVGIAMAEVQATKTAIILPDDFIANLSTEQTVEEFDKNINPIAVAYFSNREDALQWILS